MRIGLIELLPRVESEIDKALTGLKNITILGENSWRAHCPLCVEKKNQALCLSKFTTGQLRVECVRNCKTSDLTDYLDLDPIKVIGGPLYAKYFDGEMLMLEHEIEKDRQKNNQEPPSARMPDDELDIFFEAFRNNVRARFS